MGFFLTVYKCTMTLMENKDVKMPVFTMFLRDGAFCFVVVSCA